METCLFSIVRFEQVKVCGGGRDGYSHGTSNWLISFMSQSFNLVEIHEN